MGWIDIAGYGIPACYSVVFCGAVTGAIAGERWKHKLLLSSGGWVFLPCGSHYSTFAFYHDLSTISNVESVVLSAVFLVSIPTAALVNPFTAWKASGWIRKLGSTIEKGKWLKRHTNSCIAFLKYESVDSSIVLEMSDSMLDWFAEKEICDFGLVQPGANWWDLLGDRSTVPNTWKRRNQQVVENMIAFDRQNDYWEQRDLWFNYSIELYDLPSRTYVVEFFDVSDCQRKIEGLEKELVELKRQRDNLVDKRKKLLTERLNAVDPNAQ